MVVMWSKNKYPGEAVFCLDLDELSKAYNKTEKVFLDRSGGGDDRYHIRKMYTKAKVLKLFKAVSDFECDKTKAEILENITNEELKKVWEEYYKEV